MKFLPLITIQSCSHFQQKPKKVFTFTYKTYSREEENTDLNYSLASFLKHLQS